MPCFWLSILGFYRFRTAFCVVLVSSSGLVVSGVIEGDDAREARTQSVFPRPWSSHSVFLSSSSSCSLI